MLCVANIGYAQEGEISLERDQLEQLLSDPNANSLQNLDPNIFSDRALEALKEELLNNRTSDFDEFIRLLRDRETEDKLELSPSVLTREINVSLSPGAQPQKIYLSPFQPTTFTFLDKLGNPWPIERYDYGRRDAFFNPKDTESGGDKEGGFERDLFAFSLTPQSLKKLNTFVNISLEGVDTPISLHLNVVHDQYHPTPVIKVASLGPNSTITTAPAVLPVDDDELMRNLLYKIMPSNAQLLNDNSNDVTAWLVDGKMYVRTSMIPSVHSGVHHGPNGYGVYRMSPLPVIHMTSSKGHEVKVEINTGDLYND